VSPITQLRHLRLFPYDAPHHEPPTPHFTRTDHILLWALAYTLTTLSLITSAIVLYRVIKRKPRGLFTKTAVVEGGPGALQRLFDSLVRWWW